jgi:hypothetical protein
LDLVTASPGESQGAVDLTARVENRDSFISHSIRFLFSLIRIHFLLILAVNI